MYKKPTYAPNNSTPFRRPISNRFGININGIKTAEKAIIQKILVDKICGVFGLTIIGFIIAVKPKTEAILKILVPIRLSNDMPFSIFNAAIIDAANSGKLVTIEMTVTEIASSLIQIDSANCFAPFTNQLEPNENHTQPINKQD